MPVARRPSTRLPGNMAGRFLKRIDKPQRQSLSALTQEIRNGFVDVLLRLGPQDDRFGLHLLGAGLAS